MWIFLLPFSWISVRTYKVSQISPEKNSIYGAHDYVITCNTILFFNLTNLAEVYCSLELFSVVLHFNTTEEGNAHFVQYKLSSNNSRV